MTPIYYRYVQNILGGHGFVYNVGSESVEGTTSPFWLYLLTFLAFILTDLVAIENLGPLLGVFVMWVLYRLSLNIILWSKIKPPELQ